MLRPIRTWLPLGSVRNRSTNPRISSKLWRHSRQTPSRVATRAACVRRKRGVEDGNRPSHLAHRLVALLGLEQRRQTAIGRQTAHDDQVVGNDIVLDQLADAQVDVGGEPPVQLEFAAAGDTTKLGRGVIEEPGSDRFQKLVRAVTGEEHRRHVGFGHGRERGHRQRYALTSNAHSMSAVRRRRPVIIVGLSTSHESRSCCSHECGSMSSRCSGDRPR